MRNYIALYETSYCGIYTREIEFQSCHRANSKANKEDALCEIYRRFEKKIARTAVVLETRLAD